MTLTRQEVQHIADLARLALTEEEIRRFRDQLAAVLEYAAMLDELDTEDVPPAAFAHPLRNVLREDEPHVRDHRQDVLAGAPAADEGYFRVPAVWGTGESGEESQ